MHMIHIWRIQDEWVHRRVRLQGVRLRDVLGAADRSRRNRSTHSVSNVHSGLLQVSCEAQADPRSQI